MSIDNSARLCNLPRAYAVMDKFGYDALVALQAHHVLYLTNHHLRTMNVRWDVSHAAVLPRDPAKPTALVVQALELLFLAGQELAADLLQTYLAPMPDSTSQGQGVPFEGLRVRPDSRLTAATQEKIEISRRVGSQASATAAAALARVLRIAGLERARVVTDDARAQAWFAEVGLNEIDCVYDPRVFKEIRVVKSSPEIKRMRASAHANEAACRAVAARARPGMTSQELEWEFVIECARAATWPGYLVSDLGELPHGTVVADEPIMLDALSSRDGYYGDFGRTLVIGRVSSELKRRAEGLQAAWQAARAAIRPGLDYEDLKRVALEAARAAGFPECEPPVPHCLGLQHTDDPVLPGRHTGLNPNRVLEPGMVLNLDMPFVEWGWGALHREDTWLVTQEGCEMLTNDEDTLIVV